MKNLHFLTLAGCVLALSACNTLDGLVEDVKFHDWWADSGPPSAPSENLLSDGCPQAEIVSELGRVTEFQDNARPSAKTMVSAAQMSNVQSKCAFGSQSVTVDIKLDFTGARGPAADAAGSKPYFSYPFFVAVTSPGGAILAKEVFAASMTYANGMDVQTASESMRQIIPIPSKQAGGHYKVVAGFQLSPDQLNYNRAVFSAEDAARKERDKVQKAAAEKTKKNAKSGNAAEVVIVPDTLTPSESAAPPGQLQEPINIAPLGQ